MIRRAGTGTRNNPSAAVRGLAVYRRCTYASYILDIRTCVYGIHAVTSESAATVKAVLVERLSSWLGRRGGGPADSEAA